MKLLAYIVQFTYDGVMTSWRNDVMIVRMLLWGPMNSSLDVTVKA